MVGWLHMDVLKQKGTHFINYKKKMYHPWWAILAMGEVLHAWTYREHGKSLYLPLNFSGNLKVL